MNQDNAIDTLDEFTSEALDSEEIEANIHRPEDMKKQFRQTLELEESGLEELEEELEKLIQYLMSRMMGMPMDMKEIKELAHKLNLTTILNKILEIEKQQNQERRVDRPFDHSPGASEEEKKNNYPKPTMGNP